MKVFFDTEFTGLHQNTTLISIGCVSEMGRVFYAELSDYDQGQVNDWIRDNVLCHLRFDQPRLEEHPYYRASRAQGNPGNLYDSYDCKMQGTRGDVARELATWLEQFGETVEMRSDVLAYDWVLFCQLWGGAFNIPKCIYYIPFDLATLLKSRGHDPDMDREQFVETDGKHNALHDAKCIRAAYMWALSEPQALVVT